MYSEYVKILFDDGWWYARLNYKSEWYEHHEFIGEGSFSRIDSFRAKDVVEDKLKCEEITKEEYYEVIYKEALRGIEEEINTLICQHETKLDKLNNERLALCSQLKIINQI